MPLPLCIRIEADDTRSAEALRQDGWREVEVLETWCRPLGQGNHWAWFVHGVRVAEPQDLLACQAIAAHSFVTSRLHSDPKVPLDVAEQFKLDWIKRSFEQTPQDVFVHLNPTTNKVDGFLICKPEINAIRIDLIGTDDSRRQGGVATRLVGWAIDTYPGRACIVAGTQERNGPARLFYQKRGFRVIKRQRTFHK
jgi:ribosomal protein S18 acetylase RimI-like enzyme